MVLWLCAGREWCTRANPIWAKADALLGHPESRDFSGESLPYAHLSRVNHITIFDNTTA
jgi:hypothetical protein